MLPRHIVWVGGTIVYEGGNISKAYHVKEKYINDGYDDVKMETII